MESDTIVAVVTPPGEGGVGIVRASGPLAASLPPRLFPTLSAGWPSHRLRHGRMRDPATGRTVDDAMGCLMRAPRSYTGEDVAEFHCHGNPLILERVVHLCLRAGCRPARPGEFTLRAFLNGRLDLTQAEAVLDVVRARGSAGLDLAMDGLAGSLTRLLGPLRHELVGIVAHLEAMVDFVEDDIPPRADRETRRHLKDIATRLQLIIDGTEGGIILREGATLAIVGSPNVGKSSIMNGLLGLERSIVTPIPGTTRDTVEETLSIRGIPIRAVDTAGMTETDDVVEGIGIERGHRALSVADVILLVLDRSRPYAPQDEMAVRAAAGAEGRLVIALHKADLPAAADAADIVRLLAPAAVVESSAVAPGGLDGLREALADAVLGGHREAVVAGNVRHADALRRALAALQLAGDALDAETPIDLVSFDLRAAADALGEITGDNVDDELLDRIFREFCIGK
ncbi:MAG TPA: tRNA uridine-5-carboxymethylaminomethyl(34) synthesis GTPase MnmE [Chloroflexota bacterium]|nr:tRNA uridine-5-carboxymethylaminomethyl(34) synthesis GTPase MnmE [Chloroflexota bacterium]